MKKALFSLGFLSLSLGMFAQSSPSWVAQGIKQATSFAPREISIPSANTAWISIYDGSGAGTYPKTFSKTTDGTNWTAGTVGGAPNASLVGDIFALNDTTAWVVLATTGAINNNGVWKTVNGGTTWTKQANAYNPASSASFANLIHFWNENEGWTAGDPVNGKYEMYRTTNGGTTWSLVPGAPVPSASDEYGLTGCKYVVGDHVWFGTTKGRLFHSADRGQTWTAAFTPALDFGGGAAGGGVDGSSAKMAFKDGSNGLLIAVDNSVDAVMYNTTDGGANWEPMDPQGTWFFGDIVHVPGTANTYVSTGVNSSAAQGTGSSYSLDGGLNWTLIDNIPGVDGGQRGTVKFFNDTTGWCGFFSDGTAGSAGIFKFNGNFLAVNDAVKGKSNLKVFPNPAVDVVKISSDKNIKSVTVFDASGKKVKSFASSNDVNVSTLAKGTYVLQVHYDGGAVENTKLIKK